MNLVVLFHMVIKQINWDRYWRWNNSILNNDPSRQTVWKILVNTHKTFVDLQDVLKTSSRHVLSTSSTRLQRKNFSSSKTSWMTKNCYGEDVLKTSWRHVFKTSWRHILQTYWRYILKTSWRRLEDRKCLLGISVSNKSKCVSNKSIF